MIGFIAVHRLDVGGAVAFARILTVSQLMGSLPGIGLSLLFLSHHGDWDVRSEVGMLGLVLAFLCLVVLLSRNAWADGVLLVSSFIGSFYDTYAKTHRPSLLPVSRLSQALAAAAGLAIVMTKPLNYRGFVALRAAGNLVVFPFLAYAMSTRSRSQERSKYGFKAIAPALLSYAWMAASNLIFLFPALVGSCLFVSRSGALITYALQTSLQLGGRLSDYLTVNRLNGRLPQRVEMIAAMTGSVAVFLVLLRPMTDQALLEIVLKSVFSAELAISVACWGWGDMRASCQVYLRQGAKGGLSAALWGLMATGLIALGAWPANAAGLLRLSESLLVMSAGGGALLYLLAPGGRCASL